MRGHAINTGKPLGSARCASYGFSIASVPVRPRAFGLFNVRSANELHLVRGEFDMYFRNGVVTEDLPFVGGRNRRRGGESHRQSVRDYGFVTRVVIDDVVLRFHDSGLEALEVTAARGVSNRQGTLSLEDVALSLPDGSRSITTEVVRWVPGQRTFALPREFERRGGDAVSREGPGTVNLRLESSRGRG